jgi:AcrR family transcriptional regulator/DNA-binding PadR family transcriptional regulator
MASGATGRRQRVVPARALTRAARSRSTIAGIQRARLLAAAAQALEQHGYTRITVASVASRAAVSRGTFYQLFASIDDCIAGVIERIVHGLGELPWPERVRTGLASILEFFDREPLLARICLIHSERAGGPVLEYREQTIARLVAALDAGRLETAPDALISPVTAEGLVGAALRVVYARVLREDRAPLRGLLGPLVAMIVRPYLGESAVRREQTRSASIVRPSKPPNSQGPLVNIPPAGVETRVTRRTVQALEAVARDRGASNRMVADFAEISESQVSRLLARLARGGLIVNLADGSGRGPTNAWHITESGVRILRVGGRDEPLTPSNGRAEPATLRPARPITRELSLYERQAWSQLESAERALLQLRRALSHVGDPGMHNGHHHRAHDG